jgi:hypothetical protein
MCPRCNFALHRVLRLAAGVCVAFIVSAPFAAAYVATGNSAPPQIEQTGNQIDRSKKATLCTSPLNESRLSEKGSDKSRLGRRAWSLKL